jgi:hypothetical protein
MHIASARRRSAGAEPAGVASSPIGSGQLRPVAGPWVQLSRTAVCGDALPCFVVTLPPRDRARATALATPFFGRSSAVGKLSIFL